MPTILQALKARAEGSKTTIRSGDVEPVLARLMQAGLVRRDRRQGFRCIALPLASQRKLFRQPAVKPYLATIEHSLNRGYYMYPLACLAFMSRNRLAPFSIFHQALIEDRLDDVRHPLPLHDPSDMHSWHDYVEFALPPMLREPEGVAPRVLLYFFYDLSRMALATCAPAPGLSRLVAGPATLALSELPTPRLFCALCAWHTWTASRDGRAHLAKAASGVPRQRLLAACVSLLDGDAGSADHR